MKEFFNDNPQVKIDSAEYVRLLGYPIGHELQDRAKELSHLTERWYAKHGKPWVYVRKANSFDLSENEFIIDQIPFQSDAVLKRFHNGKANDVFLLAVSAGPECEAHANVLWKEGKPDEYFFMEMYGSAVVENLVMQTSAQLCAWADDNNMAVLPHYSPGYNQWDILDQLKLISLINNGNSTSNSLLVESLDSGMLKPKKSLLAIFGVTNQGSQLTAYPGMIPCEKCALRNCQYRRKPYRFRNAKRQEKVTNGHTMDENNINISKQVNYSLGLKVLKKWSEERLTLSPLEGNTIKASFIYDGTTCSNFGFPLQFEYSITLHENGDNFTILEQGCKPTTNDIGYQKMCQYIKQGDNLLETVQKEKSMVGQALDSVFDENISFSPSGCYCEKSGRDYKWHQVFQVVHFALNNK